MMEDDGKGSFYAHLPATRNYSPSKLNRVNCRFSLRSHGFPMTRGDNESPAEVQQAVE